MLINRGLSITFEDGKELYRVEQSAHFFVAAELTEFRVNVCVRDDTLKFDDQHLRRVLEHMKRHLNLETPMAEISAAVARVDFVDVINMTTVVH